MLHYRVSIKAMSGSKRTLILPYITVSILLDMSAIFLNGLIAYQLKKQKKTRIITFWFIYCLSISDVMVGITGLVFHFSMPTWGLDSGKPLWSPMTKFAFKFHHYFIQTSVHLIVIVAIDRHIHMKCLKKYTVTMTKPGSRLIMLFCITSGIILSIPTFALSGKRSDLYNFAIYTLRVTLTVLVCAIYIKTYFMIRRKYATIQIGNGNRIGLVHKEQKACERHSGTSSTQQYCYSSPTKFGLICESLNVPNNSLSCSLTNEVTYPEPQSKVFVMVQCSATTPAKTIDNKENFGDARANAGISCAVENNCSNQATELNKECDVIEAIQTTRMESKRCTLNQQLQARKITAEQDFLKALLFIFLALFICYLPLFCYKLFVLATKERNAIMQAISYITVLLQSTLNAIILLAFNKEMLKSIKSIFIKR